MTHRLFPPTIEEMCQSAMERITHFINRSAGQHGYHIRAGFQVLRHELGVV